MSMPSFFWGLPLGQNIGTEVPAEGAALAAPAAASPSPTAPAVGPAVAPAAPAEQGAAIEGQDGGAKELQPQGKPCFGDPFILILIGGFIVLYIFMSRGQRKEEKRRKLLIAEMKKGDRVMTVGGLVARVVSIDNNEVVLKIDESANVKATYTKAAIQRVLTAEDDKAK